MTLADIDWTAVREWIAAIGTSGALIIAAVTLGFEFRARRALEARLDRERQLAEEVLARRVTLTSSPEFARVPQEDGEPTSFVMIDFEVDNQGDLPIIELVVSAELPGGPWPMRLHDADCRKLRAHDSYSSWIRLDLSSQPVNTIELVQSVITTAEFTDSNGRRWITEGPGNLSRVDPVAER